MANEEEQQRGGPHQPSAASTDSSLLRWLQRGSEDAATQLYVRYAERLRMLARAEVSPDLLRRLDVDDIIQSVFASFFRGVSQGYYTVPPGEELWKLFLVIALNKIRAKGAYHRAAKRDIRLTVGENLIDQSARAEHETDPTPLAFLRLVVDEVLETLPLLHRQMILLRIEGHEVAEIAARTERSKRTVERVLQEFRKQLADLLQQGE